MSSNELRAGRWVKLVVWPDDRQIGGDEDVILQVVEATGDMAMVPWIKAIYTDGVQVLINPAHLAMIEFVD